MWAELLNQTGARILLENCGDNTTFRTTWRPGQPLLDRAACPMNFYRTGPDMRSNWQAMIRNANAQVPYLQYSQPGCFAYADMLEVVQ